MSRIAIADKVNVQTARILVFDESGALVTNVGPISNLVQDNLVQDADNDNILNINTTNETDKILAKVGKNSVYVVLNEVDNISNFNLTERLEGITKKSDLLDLLKEPIDYNNLIPVGDTEPAFLMCVYDDEVIVTNQTETLDLTGLDEGDYGFSMRRTMAKVVLESITGGVRPDGIIVGTNTEWDGNAAVDQIPDDKTNTDLIATSAVHILGLELINVPTHYSIRQDGPDSYPSYSHTYRSEPIVIASSDFQQKNGYFDRIWDGNISVSGIVPFTRIDQLADIWKVESASGNSYITVPLTDVNKIEYYTWAIEGKNPANVANTLSENERDKIEKKFTYGDYSMDSNGNITLYDTNGKEIDVPNDSPYTLNCGDFVAFFNEQYRNDNTQNYKPGTPVAGIPQTQTIIDPAVWNLVLDKNKKAYYIPENIPQNNVPEENKSYTKLRITLSIAVPTAKLTDEQINDALKNAGGGSLIQDEGKLNLNDKFNIQKYLYAKGSLYRYPLETDPEKPNYHRYAMRYAGLSRKFEGNVDVPAGSIGQYDAITGSTANIFTFEVPLNNDMVEGNYAENTYVGNEKPDGADDHNIYRGREYHVKLYVTKQGAWNNQTNTASRTINIGGEELTITGKVVTKPMK